MTPVESQNQPAAPVVSVIIPCYNSARTIRRCLRAILDQRTTVRFDVTVVDSSTDETPQIVAREFPGVRLVHLDARTFAGAARNIGVRATEGRFCLMIDSDCIARPDVIERMLARHDEGTYAAVGGALANGTPRSVSGLIGYLIEFKEFLPSTPRRLVTNAPTAIIAYRRDVIERVGGFDEAMEMSEDLLLNWQLHAAGERLLFDPLIEVTHLNRTGWREVLGYQVQLGRWSAVARRRGDLPGRVLLDHPSLIALLPLARTARAAAWLARHDSRLFLLFLLLWPAYLLAAMWWAWGFFREAIKPSVC
ncbi:MAG: glycosyltransferase [Blastocatellia bacterium]